MGVIVISVGTSLLTNNKEEIADHYNTLNREFHEKGVDINEIKGLSFEFDAGEKLTGLRPNNVDGLLEFSKSFFEKYLDEDSIKENISFRTQSCSDRLPAEISSLYLYYYHPDGGPREDTKGGDKVLLLTTDTPDAVYCAKMLEETIQRLSLFRSRCEVKDIEVIPGLDVYAAETWIGGLKNLSAFFDEFDRDYNDEFDRVLLRTGGYKEFSSDLKMLAMQYKFTSYYLFERSLNMVKLDRQVGWPTNFDDVIEATRLRPA